ncbi:MAG: dihydrodipicolinate synthase family protein [Anaerolineae bacterium]|nr:dihydrodipicolinate synthase family protein [Anaerolineae bacterium]
MDTFTVRGVIPAIFTPFTEGGRSLDEGGLRAHVQWLIEQGVHGLMPCGTTGEGLLLSTAERKRVLEVVLASASGRVPVIAHVGAVTTRETVELARHAGECGADALSVITPPFYHLTDAALMAHYCRVAEAVPATPVFLYNIPQNTGNSLSLAAAEAIVSRCPNVIGIKDSAGDLSHLLAFVALRGGSFQVVCGTDSLILQALEGGACGCVSGNANVFPDVVVGLFEAFSRGDREQARRWQMRLQEVLQALGGDGISLMKRALGMRGLSAGYVRPPLPEADDEMVAELERRLRRAQLL